MQLKFKCKVVHHRAQFLGVCKYQIQLELKYRVNKLRYVYSYVQMFPMISSTPPYHFLHRGHPPPPTVALVIARGGMSPLGPPMSRYVRRGHRWMVNAI